MCRFDAAAPSGERERIALEVCRQLPRGLPERNRIGARVLEQFGLMLFDAHWLAARGEGPSSTCRPRPGGSAPGRRGTLRGAQARYLRYLLGRTILGLDQPGHLPAAQLS